MSQPFDLSQFPDLPPEVVQAFAAQQAALEAARFEASVERAAREHEQAVGAEKDAFIAELKALLAKLEGQVQDYRRTKFGPKSEKLDPAQLELALEVEPSWRHRFKPDGEGKRRLPKRRPILPPSKTGSPPVSQIPRNARRAPRARPGLCPRACRGSSG